LFGYKHAVLNSGVNQTTHEKLQKLETTKMNYLQKFCILLLLFCLISCDGKGTQSTTGSERPTAVDIAQPVQEIEQLNAILITNPNDFNSLAALGDLYFESARYIEAIQTYDKALAVNPMCADCLNDKGLALFYTGDTKSALESFDKATELDPGYTNAWLSKGFILVSENRYQEAIAPLNKVKELDTTGVLSQEADKFLSLIADSNIQ
jgi:tetratricopeptide (TPR) repeat protein